MLLIGNLLYSSLPLGPSELQILREKSQQLKDGSLQSGGDSPHLSLATFIFETLAPAASKLKARFQDPFYSDHRLPTDELLAYDASIAALDVKSTVSQTDHPFLCESLRRQRLDLIIMLRERLHRVRSMYEPDKVAKIMNWTALYIDGINQRKRREKSGK